MIIETTRLAKIGLVILILNTFYVFSKPYDDKTERNIHVSVETWEKSPFKIRLLEGISGFNESLYLETLQFLSGTGTDDYEDESDEEDLESDQSNDKQVYEGLFKKLALSSEEKSIIDFNIVYNKFSPRVKAHYDYYTKRLSPEYRKKLEKRCNQDSFGSSVIQNDGRIDSWLEFDDKIYCSVDDLFALQTSKKKTDEIEPFDRVIGTNVKAPLMVLYGDIESPKFLMMLKYLLKEAENQKLRFVWRYIPPHDAGKENMTGYGAFLPQLTNKHTTSNIRKKEKIDRISLKKNFDKIGKSAPVKNLDPDDLKDLGTKIVSFVFDRTKSMHTRYSDLVKILQDFPKYASHLSSWTAANMKGIKEHMAVNEKLGLSKESIGLYINGSPLNKLELDVYKLVDKILDELKLSKSLNRLGFSVHQTKKLLSKFALMSAVKEHQYRKGNTLLGNNENRFRVYKYRTDDNFYKGGVFFFNDIEKDKAYEKFDTDKSQAYSQELIRSLKPGHVPPLRENIHDVIFALHLSDKSQLRTFLTLARFILDEQFPMQVGIIALPGSEKDNHLAKLLYFLAAKTNPVEIYAFLYKYHEAKNQIEEDELLGKFSDFTPENVNDDIYLKTLKRFDIEGPSIVINGVINSLDDKWHLLLRNQIMQDVKFLQFYVENNMYSDEPLKSIIYNNAKSKRNLQIIPRDPSEIKYKQITETLLHHSYRLKRKGVSNDIPASLWIIGDLNTKEMKDQLIESLLFLKKAHNFPAQLRIISTAVNTQFDKYMKRVSSGSLNEQDIDLLISKIESNLFDESKRKPNEDVLLVLDESNLPSSHLYLLFNSRYIRVLRKLSSAELLEVFEYEKSQRLGQIRNIVNEYSTAFLYKDLQDFVPLDQDFLDWFDLLLSHLTNSFHLDDNMFVNDVARYDFSSLDFHNSIFLQADERDGPIDVLLIIDPLDEDAQKYVSIVQAVMDFPFLSVRILLQAVDIDLKINSRFYRGLYPRSTPDFIENKLLVLDSATFDYVPVEEAYSSSLDVPIRQIVMPSFVEPGIDINSIRPSESTNNNISIIYQLERILVEGFARNVVLDVPASGVSLNLENQVTTKNAVVMSNFGYFQLQAVPGAWKLSIDSAEDAKDDFVLLSASKKRFNSNTKPISDAAINVFSLDGELLRVRLAPDEGLQGSKKPANKDAKKAKGGFSSLFKKEVPAHADINIFSIASGHLYERLMRIMMLSVSKNTDNLVKFWLLENFLSPSFKNSLPLLAKECSFEYEFITYKWPNWLRYQSETHRAVWGYKILFLDVIFPQSLDKVIFVDADQVARGDYKELVDMDLEGAPYGFVPMCDSKREMDGFRFWKQGYWSQVLKDDLLYHISALYVVDLKTFRKISAGDRLRNHYQKLSSDPNSLANLDQDLPNNMQRSLKIHSLPQEWLWCETWCDDDDLLTAKAIDLCNNPLSKESKVDTAKRLIPEWTEYDNFVEGLLKRAKKSTYTSDYSSPSSSSTNAKGDAEDSGEIVDAHDEL